MSNAKHTPGPWSVGIEGIRKMRYVVEGGGRDLATFDTEADALLCAAAPALLAALRATEARLTAAARAFYVGGKASAIQAALNGWEVDAEAARTAIAAAEGE